MKAWTLILFLLLFLAIYTVTYWFPRIHAPWIPIRIPMSLLNPDFFSPVINQDENHFERHLFVNEFKSCHRLKNLLFVLWNWVFVFLPPTFCLYLGPCWLTDQSEWVTKFPFAANNRVPMSFQWAVSRTVIGWNSWGRPKSNDLVHVSSFREAVQWNKINRARVLVSIPHPSIPFYIDL